MPRPGFNFFGKSLEAQPGHTILLEIHLLFRNQRYLQVELVVDGFVAQTVEEGTGTVTHVKIGTVDRNLAGGADLAIAFRCIGEEFHLFRRFLDGQVAEYLVVAFGILRDNFRDDKFGSRVLVHTEEIFAFQVAC